MPWPRGGGHGTSGRSVNYIPTRALQGGEQIMPPPNKYCPPQFYGPSIASGTWLKTIQDREHHAKNLLNRTISWIQLLFSDRISKEFPSDVLKNSSLMCKIPTGEVN